jgi:hypothetical protein
MSDVERFMYFAFNFKHNWIDDIWKDEWIKDHLKTTFKDFCDTYNGTYGFFRFYMYLDKENRKKLETWIKNNYEG